MIYVIGDIHGMADTLKNLIWGIEDSLTYKHDSIEELIFLGDYIDYGPNSKEVIDFITALPYKKTFLAGNHEDLLLQYFHKDIRDEHFSERYWLHDNEGARTIRSFTGKAEYGLTPDKAIEMIENKYIDFFENLLYIYEKEIKGHKYLFTHGNADEKRLDDFLQLDRYNKFHRYLIENDLLMYNTPVWTRKDCQFRKPEKEFVKVRDYIIVHGHTPVTSIDKTPEYVKKYQIPYIESVNPTEAKETKPAEYVGEESEMEFDIDVKDIYGINIDTGISVGYGISALGISTSNSKLSWEEDTKGTEYKIIQSRSNTINKSGIYMHYYKYNLEKNKNTVE